MLDDHFLRITCQKYFGPWIHILCKRSQNYTLLLEREENESVKLCVTKTLSEGCRSEIAFNE